MLSDQDTCSISCGEGNGNLVGRTATITRPAKLQQSRACRVPGQHAPHKINRNFIIMRTFSAFGSEPASRSSKRAAGCTGIDPGHDDNGNHNGTATTMTLGPTSTINVH